MVVVEPEPERKSERRPDRFSPKALPVREIMGYKGRVLAVEADLYRNGRDSTGTFREVVMRGFTGFTPDGWLEEWSAVRDSKPAIERLRESRRRFHGPGGLH